MKRWAAVIALAFVGTVSVGDARMGAAPQADVRQQFVGNYRLVSYVQFPEGGEQRTLDYAGGRIMYDAHGNMAAQLMRGGRQKYAAAQPTDQERAAAYSTYTAYFGRYVIDPAKGTVTHHVEGALNQGNVGTPLVRWYKFSEDGSRLMLSLKSGERITGTLTWERLK